MSQADQYQREAIHIDGHGLVSACPGAGKTRVLAQRSSRLLSSNDRGNLVAVTFTRDAAQSLRSRILAEAGKQYSRRLAAGTFHSLALSQFKKQTGRWGFRLLSPGEQAMLFDQAFRQARFEANFTFDRKRDALEAIEAIKAAMDEPPDPRYTPEGALYAIYQRMLDNAGACDFADLLLRAVRDMRADRLKPINARWMLVDEAQDMDAVQYAWIAEHAKAGVEIMCVADDDQSIYQWRHALGHAGLMQFKDEHHARHVTLPINYRCRPEVLGPATTLIECNTERVPKDIQPARAPGGSLYVLANGTRTQETEQIANRLQATNPGEWAILARTNFLLDAVQLALASAGIPFKRIGGKSFWESGLAQAFIGLLKATYADDAIALMTALNWAGLFDNDYVEPNEDETAGELLSRLSQAPAGQSPGIAQRQARVLRELHADWQDALTRGRIGIVAWGAAQWLGEATDPDRAKALTWCAEALGKLPGDMQARVMLLTLADKDKSAEDGACLMTMHAAKGLEFPNVWIIGCENGRCPHGDSDIEEERRLFYVGMTRAEDNLVLSFARDEGEPSPFIEEADITRLTVNALPSI